VTRRVASPKTWREGARTVLLFICSHCDKRISYNPNITCGSKWFHHDTYRTQCSEEQS
jgi:hypothetical protein